MTDCVATETATEYVDLLTDILAPRYQLPDGYDSWAIKSVRLDLRTRNEFRWPWPGNATVRLELDDHDDPCPRRVGDGLCIAKTWKGMASSLIPARTLLLVAYRQAEARGNNNKLRVPQVWVVDVIDGEQLLIRDGFRADLADADLRSANLDGADLDGANLHGANLHRANLDGAEVRSANLDFANLRGANLRGANLYGANLRGADLHGAYLWCADLRCADLRDANLRNADLRSANLDGADLDGAHLHGANLYGHDPKQLEKRGAQL